MVRLTLLVTMPRDGLRPIGLIALPEGGACDVLWRQRDLSIAGVFARHDVVMLASQRRLWPGAVGVVRRRGLVSGRRLSQRFPGRLARERFALGLAAAEKVAEPSL